MVDREKISKEKQKKKLRNFLGDRAAEILEKEEDKNGGGRS